MVFDDGNSCGVRMDSELQRHDSQAGIVLFHLRVVILLFCLFLMDVHKPLSEDRVRSELDGSAVGRGKPVTKQSA
jgi:hypothetical protein